ncbi:E3 ubiquitin-protein ligase MGRN1 [Spatholobus suberectus]|nr:E3 ubiquitin-protein ligase MGRN1 [Spatholobus suberectus]
MMEGRRRVTLYEQMSASDSSRARVLAGLTLDDVLANQKRPSSTPPSQQPPKSRTLLDIIKEDETNKKDRRSWKAFKDKLRLKRAGSAWTSSIHIPTSDVPVPHPNSRTFTQFGRRNSVRFPTHSNSDMSTQYKAHQVEDLDPTTDGSGSPATAPAARPQFNRHGSTRFAGDTSDNTAGTLRPQLSRRNSTTVPSEPYRRGRVVTFRDSFDDDEADDDDKPDAGRTLSAREAVAAQEAAEAAAAAEAEAAAAEQAPVTMSLMDLLEETDREMGLEGSRYILSDDEDFDEDEDEEGEDDEDGEGAMEYTCCVCMVRHKAAAFIPCGHTFCRMCSRELMVSRGNCPLCNNFILEILDIF